jgi:hypothetical protein
MKKSFQRGKLQLTSEAVRNLTSTQLDAVAGGLSTFATLCNCNGPTHQARNTCAPIGCVQ